jgi:hypothetical protein
MGHDECAGTIACALAVGISKAGRILGIPAEIASRCVRRGSMGERWEQERGRLGAVDYLSIMITAQHTDGIC